MNRHSFLLGFEASLLSLSAAVDGAGAASFGFAVDGAGAAPFGFLGTSSASSNDLSGEKLVDGFASSASFSRR
ncbi:hypothetical protein SLE2022_137110 [Rubroshorea leprosula]